MPSILFVCLGNICRSPLAEAALREEARRRDLDLIVDSAGTGNWHAGEPPDPRAVATAARNGVDIRALRARQVTRGDFTRFDHIVALDHDNLKDLRRLAPANSTAQLSLLLDHVPGREGQAVADPWFGDEAGFDITWAEVTAATRGLIGSLPR
jgi:protein-tyrosine phosphatase